MGRLTNSSFSWREGSSFGTTLSSFGRKKKKERFQFSKKEERGKEGEAS
jgi:hypothetical protein